VGILSEARRYSGLWALGSRARDSGLGIRDFGVGSESCVSAAWVAVWHSESWGNYHELVTSATPSVAPRTESRSPNPESRPLSPESRDPSPETRRPTTVAIVGASNNRRKFGNRALRAFRAQGYQVIAINPHEREVEGVQAYGSVLDVPGAIDMATVYVPPGIGVRLLSEFAQKEIAEIWINPGAESNELLKEARRLQLKVIVACSILAIGQDPYAG